MQRRGKAQHIEVEQNKSLMVAPNAWVAIRVGHQSGQRVRKASGATGVSRATGQSGKNPA
tara:strand:- start:1959 stop:2138 length:180 start_codon:yes stop_codon:yes gene_type:complete